MSLETEQQTLEARTAFPDDWRAEIGRVIAGRYRLDGVIGEGSMGTVWAATDEVLLRRVAIKDIKYPPGVAAPEVARLHQRLLREARAVAGLSHPNVVTVYDVLTTATGPVIVMELLQARSVADIVARHGRLTPAQAASIGVAVASALTAAHAAGIIHRDVKPANVLIGSHDSRVTLTDFGLARSSDDQTMTAAGFIMGSPAQSPARHEPGAIQHRRGCLPVFGGHPRIAPEIAQGEPVDPASDAWSLGALLFYCVEGRPPFDEGTAFATLKAVVTDPVPPHPHSGDLGRTITGLLVKSPSRRMSIHQAMTNLTMTLNGVPSSRIARPSTGRSLFPLRSWRTG